MSNSFKDYILEQLSGLEVKIRPMFGGFGLYLESKFFGIISEDQLFFKVSANSKKDYEKLGSKPFAPSPKQTLKNYYEVPSEIINNSNKLKEWATISAAQ
jgi:DNA transformation protein